MSMATATVENSQHTATEDILTDTATLGKGKVPNATAAATAEVTQDDSGTAGAAIVSDNSEEASIEFVSREQPDSTITATENMATTATASAPFEGDGADPAQPVPSRSTFDWLAYTVSLNYNRLAASLLSPLTHWHWHDPISNTSIILGAVPSQHLLFQLKRDHGVQNIVNMCAEFKGYLQTMKELGLVQCWLPTRDFSTPSVENIWAGVRFIEKCEKGWNERGEEGRGKIYVHCKAGRGRSATVVLSWLVYCYKLTVIEAQVILLKARGQVDKNVYLHPEVISFYEQVLDQEKNGTLERKVWPDHTDHVNNDSESSGVGEGEREGDEGQDRAGEASGGGSGKGGDV